jgi:hypothetical protein
MPGVAGPDPTRNISIYLVSDLSDPAKEKLAEAAAEILPVPDVEDEAPAAPADLRGAPAPAKSHRG